MSTHVHHPVTEAVDAVRAGPIAPATTSVVAFVGRARQGPVEAPVAVGSVGEYEGAFGGPWDGDTLGVAVRDFFANGGEDAVVVRVFEPGSVGELEGAPLTASDIVGPGLKAAEAGLYALDRIPAFNLLVIAPHTPDGSVDPVVVRAAEAYCRDRRAILLLDGLSTWSSADDVLAACESGLDAVLGAASENAALFFPRLRQRNPFAHSEIGTYSAIGAVAGVIARTDARAGVWTSPAGQQALLNRVPGLDVELTAREITTLTAAGVSCLRSIPGGGRVVWGARTLQGADSAGSPWKYLSVRRTALFIEESVARGTSWVASEPNTEPTWSRVREDVAEFMHGLFRAGAFPASSTPDDAYVVSCGPGTTPADLDRAVVVIEVGFTPVRAGEFVMVRVEQAAGRAP